MARFWWVFLYILLVVEIVAFLLPAIFMFLVGLLAFAFGATALRPGTHTILYVTALVLFHAYPVWSLCWLIVKHFSIEISGIPRSIWVGLCLGVLHVLQFLERGISSWGKNDGELVSYFALGPLIVLGTLLAIMRFRPRKLSDSSPNAGVRHARTPPALSINSESLADRPASTTGSSTDRS